MRHVMTSKNVVECWAKQSQEWASNSGRTLWFDGPHLYSYDTVIACIHESGCDFSPIYYSKTTTRHTNMAKRAYEK